MCHDSAAVALAVLFKKPIIFITSSSIKNKRYMGRIIEYSNFFKQKPLNISKLSNEKFEKKIFYFDNDAYRKYSNNFLRHPKAKKKLISQQIINCLAMNLN